MIRSLTGLFFVLILSSCSVPETKIYNLAIPPDNGRKSAKSEATLVIILTAPRYLTQSYIAYRKSPYQLEISRYSKWDSAPDDMLKDMLRDSISSTGIFSEVRVSNMMPHGFYALKINLKRFERADSDSGSSGELVFDYNLISPEGKELRGGSVAKSVKLEDGSFLSLAKGLSSALKEGLDEVKTNIASAVPLK